MKKIFIVLLFVFLLTQNNDYNELNDLAIVNSIIIDYNNNNYNLYLQTQNPKDNNNYIIYNTTNKNIKNTFKVISKKSPNKLYYKHLNTLYITNNSIPYIKEILYYFIDNNITRNEFYILLINNNNINEIINMPTIDIKNIIKNNNYNKPTFDNILNKYLNPNTKLTIPKLNYKNNNYNISTTTVNKELIYE